MFYVKHRYLCPTNDGSKPYMHSFTMLAAHQVNYFPETVEGGGCVVVHCVDKENSVEWRNGTVFVMNENGKTIDVFYLDMVAPEANNPPAV